MGDKRRFNRGRRRSYIVRSTNDPEYDVERNWTGWMGSGGDTEEDAKAHADQTGRSEGRVDVRKHKSGKFVLVDYDGLAGYGFTARGDEDAMRKAPEHIHEQGWPTAEATRGQVRHVGEVEPGWHLFEADDVIPETQARQEHARQYGEAGGDG